MSSSARLATAAGAAAAAARPIVITGPSGVGKGTLIARLQKEFPDAFGFSVSHTTRMPRAGEENGVHYNFTTREVMEPMVARGEFLESADVHGNMYGTSFSAVRSVAALGRSCILDIDVQGAASCRRARFDVAAYVFVAPPSTEELLSRLRGRGTETEDKIQKRVANASAEIASASAMWWDAWVLNDDLDRAYEPLKRALRGYGVLPGEGTGAGGGAV